MNMMTSNTKVMVPCDIHKVWETILAVENHHMWRSDVSKREVIDEKQFIEYTKNGYATTFTVTAAEPYRKGELELENRHVKGHCTVAFSSKGGETEIDMTASVSAKQLFMRAVGRSVFERTYLEREQARFVTDLEKLFG